MAQDKFKIGDFLFKAGDSAEALFVIQKGQVRLSQPKGKGFVEVDLLKNGDLLGEENLFNTSNAEKSNYSMSAEVVTTDTEVMKVPYAMIKNQLEGIPAIIKVLLFSFSNKLQRLQQKLKELDRNSVSLFEEKGYIFLQNHEVNKMISLLSLLFTASPKSNLLSKKTIKIFMNDTFGLAEAKTESMISLLKDAGIIAAEAPLIDGQSYLEIKNSELLKDIMNLYQKERFLTDEKQLQISKNSLMLLEKIVSTYSHVVATGNSFSQINMTEILDYFIERQYKVDLSDLDDAKKHGLVGESLVGEGGVKKIEANLEKIRKYVPIIKFQHALKKLNDAKK